MLTLATRGPTQMEDKTNTLWPKPM